MLKHAFHGLLVAGLCIVPAFAEEEARVESSYSDDASLRSERVESSSTTLGAPVREDVKSDTGDKADRSGPVPFADIGKVGGGADESLLSEKAIEQDKGLLVRGEIRGEDLILHLPEGTKQDTLSLRSGAGLDLKHSDLLRLGRFEGNDLILSLSGVRARGELNLDDLWLWGTGAESASMLQRVKMGETRVAGVSTEVKQEGEVRSFEPQLEARADTRIESEVRSDASVDTRRTEIEREDDGDVEIERKEGDREVEIERDEDGDVDVDVDDD